MMIKILTLLVTFLLFFIACSDEDKASSDNVWKEQTQALDKAKEVEGLLKDATDQQRKIIDEQPQ